MKYIFLSVIITIFFKRLSERRYDYFDVLFVLIYSIIMNILEFCVTFSLIMALFNILFMKYYFQWNYKKEDKSNFFLATMIQYCISFSFDLLPVELLTNNATVHSFISYLLLCVILFIIDKTEILKKNVIDHDYKKLLISYMIIALIFIYYVINKLNYTEGSFLIITIELYFFLSTIILALIVEKIALHSEEIRIKEIENLEFKNINEQYNIAKYKSQYFIELKHDLYYLKSLFEKHKEIELSKQIHKLISSIDQIGMNVYTNNIMVNSLINQMKTIAFQNNITLDLDIHCSLEEIELGIKQYDAILSLIKVVCINNKEAILVRINTIDSSYIIELYSPNKNITILDNEEIIIDESDEYLSIKYIIE